MSIEELIGTLKKRWKIILISLVLFLLSAVILSFFIMIPKYEASTRFFIGKQTVGDDQNYNPNDVVMYQNLMKTYSEIIKTPDILKTSIEKSKANISVEDVASKLKVEVIADTQILEVSYRGTSYLETKELVNNLTNEFISVSKELVPNGNIKILQRVMISEEPVTPNKKMNIIIGIFAGIVSGVILAFVVEIFDKTIRNKSELESNIDLPIIGMLPLIKK
ncbi:Wzz/FepE/Etk N-terminal domain-containing protein [Clostridium sp.]|uniref:YveK family protein n=1 Tax=Clostridium sp. TaxID=1506 RepID=UPI00290C09CA|nr:Wzz/FepE/Etk N-terminal domain-containing protein [Clostridium sp.]MDU5107835.1 Wzz/FepE/Etk N-terminal domain-containing protein [Clostridium sp.]